MKRYDAKTVAWAEIWNSCWRCGKRGAWKHGLEIHHMTMGPCRRADELATCSVLCNACHTTEHHTLQHLGLWKLLALKRHFDAKNFSLAAVTRARGRAGTSITIEEINAAEKELGLATGSVTQAEVDSVKCLFAEPPHV
jgi:hypothetical protein